MKNFAEFTFLFLSRFNKNIYRNSLHNIENILVGRTVGADFFFLGVAVKVENINLVETFKQIFSAFGGE